MQKKQKFLCNKKTKQIFEINKKSVLASYLISKGHTGFSKIYSVIGFAPPVSDFWFTEHMNLLKAISFKLYFENMNLRGKDLSDAEMIWGRCLKCHWFTPSFDGSWRSIGWPTNKGIV